jgi:hypothetical protein
MFKLIKNNNILARTRIKDIGVFLSLINKIFSFFGFEKKSKEKKETSIYLNKDKTEIELISQNKEIFEEFDSIWEHLFLRENSQAFFISNVVGFEEWVSMDEILRRIEELFGIKFKNKRSLYPYIKTMVDLNLMESLSVGDKMKWRKKETLIKIKKKKKKLEEVLVSAEN